VIRHIFRTSASISIAALACAVAPLLLAKPLAAQEALTMPPGLPEWTFNIPGKEQPIGYRPEGTVKVPGSAKEYEAGTANPPDWFPDEHPAAPKVVTGGAGTGIRFACGACHLMSGQSHAEAADIAGMPAEYLVRQMTYYKSGVRQDDARMGPIAKATSDEDIRQAADYFASLKPGVFVKVIETATPPKTYVSADARHRRIVPDGGTEPIGRRIIQIPEDPMQTTIRNPHSGFTAYVPPGSIARGKALALSGDSGKTIQCAICHGDALTGLGEVPRIAGLQPVYIARQLLQMQNGTSAGINAALMKKVVAKLSEDDVIALAAYLGSLSPR
jgi:cytochrome c553